MTAAPASWSAGVAALGRAFRDGSVTPTTALERCFAAAERGRPDKAIRMLIPTAAADAAAATRRFGAGAPLGPLDGVPLVVKDVVGVAQLPTSGGGAVPVEPAREDAEVVRRLRSAGAILFAKTNMTEFGLQPTGINPHHGTPVNPWDAGRLPGGSSSGSAVAVASGIAPAAIGSDAGGSIRIPGALNGLVGLKPTFGAIPLTGCFALTRDLDHLGPIGWTVDDVSAIFEVCAGRTLAPVSSPARVAMLEDFVAVADPEVAGAVREAALAVFGDMPSVRTPSCAWSVQVGFVEVGTQAAETQAQALATDAHHLGADARATLRLAMGLSPTDRRRSAAARSEMRRELGELLSRFDVLVAPTIAVRDPRLHPSALKSGEIDLRSVGELTVCAFPANLTGLPAVTVPCVRSAAPIGMQLIAGPGRESDALAAARLVEAQFGPRRPPRWYGYDDE